VRWNRACLAVPWLVLALMTALVVEVGEVAEEVLAGAVMAVPAAVRVSATAAPWPYTGAC
jgi:hypothetical protein